MLWAGGGRGGDLYCMGNGLLIFARADDGADRLFHGALLSTVNYLLIVISAEDRSVMLQLPTSGSGSTVTAIIYTPGWCAHPPPLCTRAQRRARLD